MSCDSYSPPLCCASAAFAHCNCAAPNHPQFHYHFRWSPYHKPLKSRTYRREKP